MNKRLKKSGSEPTTSCFDKDRKVPTRYSKELMFSLPLPRVRVKLHWDKSNKGKCLNLGRTRHYNFLWQQDYTCSLRLAIRLNLFLLVDLRPALDHT